MNKIIYILLISAAIFLSGCATGPFMAHEPARTVGYSKSELIAGAGQAGYVFKWNYGVGHDLDIGVQLESFTLGLRAKYAFINQQSSGWSLAGAAGTGVGSFGGSHYYADLIGSYLKGSWEPYTTLRAVHVKTDAIDFRDEDTGEIDFTVSENEYEYGQFILGTRYWFTPNWLLSVEGSTIFSISSSFDIKSNAFFSASFGYRF